MPRFVILEHQSPRGLHWDFMLQRGDRLVTWALAQQPAPQAAIPAEALADHRLAYLDYEGPISGGRGTVTRWDWGIYDTLRWDAKEVVVRLSGVRLSGEVRLAMVEVNQRAAHGEAEPPTTWCFVFSPPRGGRQG